MTSTSLRWAVNVGAWAPSQEQWGVALAALPEQEQARCLRFRQPEDQRRAVVSQLLQRACICAVLGVGWADAAIARTRGAKPFYAGAANRSHAPNFNYNVSHEVGLQAPAAQRPAAAVLLLPPPAHPPAAAAA